MKKSKKKHDAVRKNQSTIRSYKVLTQGELTALRQESMEVIIAVLTIMRVEGKLPPILKCEFPRLKDFTWPSILEPGNLRFEADVIFAIARVLSNKTKLDALLSIRRQFSRCIIDEDFKTGKEMLEYAERNFGSSLWMLEAKLLVASIQGGITSIRDCLAGIIEANPSSNVNFLATFASYRVDLTMTMTEYRRRILKALARVDYKATNVSLPIYISFLLRDQSVLQTLSQSPLTVADASYIFRGESCRPILDSYDSICRLIEGSIENPELFTILRSLEPAKRILEVVDPDNLRLQAFFGEIHPSRVECEKNCAEQHLDYALYKLESIAEGQVETATPKKSDLMKDLQHATTYTLRHRVSSPLAFVVLAKLGAVLGATSLGYQITGLVRQTMKRSTLSVRVIQLLTSQSALGLGFPLSISSHFGNQLNSTNLSIDQPALLKAVLSCDSATPIELLTYAQDLICTERYAEAFVILEQLLSSSECNEYVNGEVVRGMFDCLVAGGNELKMASVLERSNINPIATFFLIDVGMLIDAYLRASRDEFDKQSIVWPNLFWLGFAFDGRPRKDLYHAYVSFLKGNSYIRPHEIIEADHTFGENQLKFFLLHVCSIEVMQSDWRSFATLADVEAERITILHQLQATSPEDSVVYAEEISAIQQTIAIRRIRNVVSEAKIYFNFEGVVKQLSEQLAEQFDRLRHFLLLPEGERVVPISKVYTTSKTITVVADLAFDQFKEIVDSILETVLYSNEHGLDTFLSVRIRHQTLKGAIRSVFDRNNLICEKSENVYRSHKYWSDTLQMDGDVAEKTDSAIIRLSREVDRVIDTASNKWIRIRHATEFPEGWIDLRLNDQKLSYILKGLEHLEKFEQFFPAILEYITEAVSEALSVARSNVKSVIEPELLEVLENFSDEIRTDVVPGELLAAVTRCRTELQQTLTGVAGWFQLQGNLSVEQFDFRTFVQASIENIRNCFPSSSFSCEHDCEFDVSLSGRIFPHLWDIFFVLLENIVTHAESESKFTRIVSTLSGDELRVEILNRLVASTDVDSLVEHLQNRRQSEPSIVRRERGSGLAKVLNSLECNLGVTANDAMGFSLIDNDLCVTLRFPFNSIRYEVAQ